MISKIEKLHLLRYITGSLIFYLGVFYTLSVFGNLTDYDFNFAFVKTLLTMKSVPEHAGVAWRSINSHTLISIAYWVIILAESLIAIVAFWGAFDIFRNSHKDKIIFDRAKSVALIAVALGISLYFFGYLVIGDQWFRAWMGSAGENVEDLAFKFNAFFCFLYIIVRLTP